MRNNQSKSPRPAGTVLVVALVVLTFLILLGAALSQTLLLFHRQALRDDQQRQALLLAESAIRRATRSASTAADYQGETWHVPSQVLGDGAAGVAVIRLEIPKDSAVQRRVIVEATYPDEGSRRFVYRREAWIDVPITPKSPDKDTAKTSS